MEIDNKYKKTYNFFIFAVTLGLVLFSCEDDYDNNEISNAIHPSVNIKIESYSAVIKSLNMPQFKIQAVLKNTGDCDLKNINFHCEVKTKSRKTGKLF